MANQPKRLGQYLIELGFVTEEQLKQGLAEHKSGKYPGCRLGDVLIKLGLLTRATLDKAIEQKMLDMYEM